jgi:hypothetical protein
MTRDKDYQFEIYLLQQTDCDATASAEWRTCVASNDATAEQKG